jgi:hypothetical protein
MDVARGEKFLTTRCEPMLAGVGLRSKRCRCPSGSETYDTLLTNAETRNFAWNNMSSGALSLCVFPLVFSAEDLPKRMTAKRAQQDRKRHATAAHMGSLLGQ